LVLLLKKAAMKRLLAIVTIAICCTSNLFAQTTKDRQAVQTQIEALLHSWNQHDFSDMKNYTTADVDWVNIVGMWWKGRGQVQYAHEAFHKTIFKNVPVELKSSDIRFITKEVAVAHITTYYGEFTTPSGQKMGNTEDLATLVYVKRKGKWLLTAGENVTVNEGAKQHDPVLEMRSK
jgi:uncharacterized protein (TIGR02246 family)